MSVSADMVNGVLLEPAAADRQGEDAANAARVYLQLDAAFEQVGQAMTNAKRIVAEANRLGFWVNPNEYADPTGAIRYAVKLTRDVPRT
jgi:hypothetical protein